MALLTAEEREKLAKEGLWVKEKCDGCSKPILSPVSYIKKIAGVEKVFCSSCVKGHDFTMSNIKEENEMATKKAEKKAASKKEGGSKKVGGYLNSGTPLSDMYLVLEDGKRHSFTELSKICAKYKRDLKGRLGNLLRVGLRKKAWSLLVDDDEKTVQMKLGVPSASSPKTVGGADKKKEKPVPAKKATSKKEQEPEEKEAVPSKALKATAALIRRTLKTGKDWTKNKLIESLKEDLDQDPKRVEAALKEEIKAGGITVEDGVLVLA